MRGPKDFHAPAMTKRIFYDGLNLGLSQGTGIATYTRVLTQVSRSLGYETGVLYSSGAAAIRNPALREIGFFDERTRATTQVVSGALGKLFDYGRCVFPCRPISCIVPGSCL